MADEDKLPCTYTGFRPFYHSHQALQLDQHRYVRKDETSTWVWNLQRSGFPPNAAGMFVLFYTTPSV